MTHVNPAILTWARETAGLALPEAAQKVGLRDTRRGAGAERLAALEAGEGEVGRPTLLKMAQVYRRPLITFYLAKPPPKADRGEDFRTLPDDQRAGAAGAVDALVRDIRAEMVEKLDTTPEELAHAVEKVGPQPVAVAIFLGRADTVT